MEAHDCVPGARASVTLTVSHEDTASALRTGDVEVLASPRVLMLAEEASVKALGDCLPPERTSVGSWAQLDHRAPSHVGAVVTAEAALLGVHGRRLEFSVILTEGEREIAHCRHRRIVVDRSSFLRPESPQAGAGSEADERQASDEPPESGT